MQSRQVHPGNTLQLGAAALVLLVTALAAPAARAAGSLRIGTYNTHLIVDPLGISDWATEDEKDLAAFTIAERINVSDYDVIALNEVFDDETRAIIHKQTRAEYPYQVMKLFARVALEEQDSGLMLLSRYPFVADPVQHERQVQRLPPDVGVGGEWEPRGSFYRNGSTSNMGRYVRFAGYGAACSGADCLADKGVGIVAINVTMGAGVVRRTAFLFTHLDAGDRSDRTKQFEIIQKLFGAMDYQTRFTKDDVFILGDLNVTGPMRGIPLEPNNEWTERFATPDGVASWFVNGGDAFRDAWYNEGFRSDQGYTHNTQRKRQRIDYIMRNAGAKVRSENLCNQHMGRAYNLQFGGSTIPSAFSIGQLPPAALGGAYNFSDHHGLNMELGLLTDHCSPAAPNVAAELYGDARYGALDLLDADRNKLQAAPITVPGGVYWYRMLGVEGASAWAFMLANTSAPGSNIEIYEAEEFSRPVRSYKGDFYAQTSGSIRIYSGRRFLFDRANTYYVKVSLKDRNATGTVRWKYYRLDCGSDKQYCPLAPNQTSPRVVMEPNKGFPDPTSSAAGASVHAIDVPPLYSGASQTIVVGELGAGIDSGMDLLVMDSNFNLLGSTGVKLSGDADCRDANGGIAIACRKLTINVTGPKRLYVYNVRAHIANPESFKVFWKSQAVVLHGSRRPTFEYADLSLMNARDGGLSGNDELEMGLVIDGFDIAGGYRKLPLNSEFEEGETYWLDYYFNGMGLQIDKRYFKDNITLRFVERDDFLNGGDDHVDVQLTPSWLVPATGTGSYGPNSAGLTDQFRQFNLSNESNNSEYRLWVGASRGWPADCYITEAIGCHESWQDWDRSLIFP